MAWSTAILIQVDILIPDTLRTCLVLLLGHMKANVEHAVLAESYWIMEDLIRVDDDNEIVT